MDLKELFCQIPFDVASVSALGEQSTAEAAWAALA